MSVQVLSIVLIVLALAMGFSAAPLEIAYDETNPMQTAGYTEGDMILSKEIGRNGISDSRFYWPNGILYYRFDSSIDVAQRTIILSVMREIETQSCIKFKEGAVNQPYVNVTARSNGCFATVGYQGKVQVLNLQKKACDFRGTVIHEFLHALGFYHMQNTWNRDDYLEVHYENIISGQENNFIKLRAAQVNDFGVEYDFYSVIQYPLDGFSKNGKKTMVPLEPVNEAVIGRAIRMTLKDIAKLSTMYKC